MTLYASDKDRTIEASRRYAGNTQRAGGLPPVIVEGVDTIDVSEIGSSLLSLNHSDYADNPILLRSQLERDRASVQWFRRFDSDANAEMH